MNYADKAKASIAAALAAQSAAMLDTAAAFNQDMNNAATDDERARATADAQRRLSMLYGADGAAKIVTVWLQQELNDRIRKHRKEAHA